MARVSGNFADISSYVYLQNSSSQDVVDEVCINVFFADLKDICVQQPVVIMLDSYEKCERALQEWLEEFFLDKYFFDLDSRPNRLVTVIAGRQIPDFELRWSKKDCELIVVSVKELGKWGLEEIKALLRAHGYSPDEAQVTAMYEMIQHGVPPSMVVDAMDTLQKRRRQS